MATHYLSVSWDEFHRDAKQLAERLAPAGPWRGIVAISRGGLVPATIIARALNIRVVETVSVVAYDQLSQGEEALGEPKVTKLPDFAGDGEGFLIIDDLVDTGTTARVVRALLPKAYFACVYAKPAGRGLADNVLKEVSQDTWIVLPWEQM
ncbi:MAG TPA: xanthine phosphoribosyltransferase [Acetobacteraceae bacterium]|jgi:xanthine phosphoribosyltransferase|nr:xanthine phosphoribosyltransferase [Acetobacteraceae bacterium]